MSTQAPPETTSGAGAREWLGLAVLGLPTVLLAVDNNVLFLALPHLRADLAPSGTQLLWIMDVYGFMIAGFLVTMGSLGDRIGRRRLLLVGAGAFGLASVAAAYAGSAELLIAARALLGVAGATLMPSTLALIRTMFTDTHQRVVAVAVWTSCFLVGGAVAPVVGGLLLERFWWGSVFLMGVPVMGLLLALAPALLPESRATTLGRLDPVSVALSLAAILPAVHGLKELAADGPRAVPLLALAAGTGCAVLFVRRQRRLADPLLDLRLFADRSFGTALAVLLTATLVMGGALLFVTQYLQLVAGMPALRSGLLLVVPTLGLLAGNLLAPYLSRRFAPVRVIVAALVVAAAGFVLLTRVGDVGLPALLAGHAVAGLGLGPLAVLSTALVVGAAPAAKAGSAASLSETSGELGVALGVATLGSLGAAVYRAELAGSLPPAATAGAADTHDSLAAAVTAAERLPAGPSADVVEAARAAFTSGLTVVAWASAAVVLALAVVAPALLRRAPH